jgi:putative heme-binding domain-containing protein
MWRLRFSILLLSAGALLAQHEYPQADIENGQRLYVANCTYCHGPDGDQIPGVDLAHGKFKRATTDAEIISIIRNGIPNTGMPAHTINESQISTIVAYLRSLAAIPTATLPGGDAARGKAIFEGKGGCLNCHRVLDKGSRLGPDLSDIGMVRRTAELEKSVLDPNDIVLPQHRFFRVVTKSGTTVTGRLLNQDTFTVQIMDEKQKLLSFPKSDLKEFTMIKSSAMPSFKDKLSSKELADLVTYLASLKGV